MKKGNAMVSGNPSGENKNTREEREAPMGLTEAFAPVADSAAAGARHHGHAAEEEGSPMGLTQAFAPVDARQHGGDEEEGSPMGLTEAFAAADGGEEEPRPRGRHARHAAVPVDFDDDGDEAEEARENTGDFPPVTLATLTATDEGRELSADPEKLTRTQKKALKQQQRDAIPAYMKKSRRTRRILTAVVILLILLAGAGVYFVTQLVSAVGDSAVEKAQVSQDNQDVTAIDSSTATDASAAEKTTTVPDLASLLGKTSEEAAQLVGRGATVAMEREVSQEGSAIVKEVRLSLNDEPADARIGVPTVYLGLDSNGAVVQAGYSASTSSLGYGSLSFADAVQSEHLVERTLQEAGANVEDGAAVLPEDSSVYSTYGPDGATLTREYCSFGGSVTVGDQDCVWSAILSYDYNTANATGNLADTVRTVYVYLDSPAAQAPVTAEEPPAEGEATE